MRSVPTTLIGPRAAVARFVRNQQRQPDDELASRRRPIARRLDLAAMQLDDSTRDAQSQPQSAAAGREASTCVNGSNTRSRFWRAMPMPVSRTLSRRYRRCSSVTVIWPPGSVNFAAFSSRLVMTCFSRPASPLT